MDTPGHEDFSEDTYRTLTAVDSVLMVIDGSKGVEDRTIKLMEVCRMRKTPIFTFVNKIDREIRDPIELLDEIESVLNISCAPINWPIGMASRLKGLYDLKKDMIRVFKSGKNDSIAGTEEFLLFERGLKTLRVNKTEPNVQIIKKIVTMRLY